LQRAADRPDYHIRVTIRKTPATSISTRTRNIKRHDGARNLQAFLVQLVNVIAAQPFAPNYVAQIRQQYVNKPALGMGCKKGIEFGAHGESLPRLNVGS
jgi:hypothetical protein